MSTRQITMADNINIQHCKTMKEALESFQKNTLQICEDLQTACATCNDVLGEDDIRVKSIVADANKALVGYKKLAKEAKRIADLLQSDLIDPYNRQVKILSDNYTMDE